MKKLTCIVVVLMLLAAIAALAFFSCNKASTPVPVSDPDQLLIQAARSYMEQHEPSAPPMTDSLPFTRTSLHKTPRWSQAQVQSFSFGRGVVVPISIAEPLGIRVGPNQVPISASSITWLLLYQDAAKQWHPEVITRLPNDTAAGPFQGKVRVEDWQGNFQKGFLYLADTTLPLGSSTNYKRATGAQGYTKAPSTYAALEIECTTTDWYACYSYDGVDAGCDYAYSEEECTTVGGGGGGGSTEGSSPTGEDYGAIGGGGSITTGNPAGTSTAANITPDTSIVNNSLVNCVYNHLMSAQLTNGLRSILSAFGDNQVYNIHFALGTLDSDGMCQYLGNDNFKITINVSEANDPSYSRIYLASTFLHEAFHARLRQKALETFGEANISAWPMPIDDMDLTQLANCFEAEAKSQNIWESVEHDWMVNNIDQLGQALQQYVKTFYSSTYATVGPDLSPYEDLMYMGLQGCTLYQEDVADKGLQTIFQSAWAKLNEGGKCND